MGHWCCPFQVYGKPENHNFAVLEPSGIWLRWLQELQSYDFQVFHKPGKDNTNADNLSRCDHLPEPTAEETKEAEEEYVRNLYQYVQELDEEDRIREMMAH